MHIFNLLSTTISRALHIVKPRSKATALPNRPSNVNEIDCESEDYRDIVRCAARLKILVTCPSLRCLAKAYTSMSSALSRAARAESSTDIAQLCEGRTPVSELGTK